MVLLVSDWESNWAPLIVASDASGWGCGLCGLWSSVDDVAAVGRVRERDRYLDPDHVAARAAALGCPQAAPS
eukprot:9064446-Pyramimonas_sp.AAC.1